MIVIQKNNEQDIREAERVIPCEGCKTRDILKHNGTYVLIKGRGAPKAKQKFVSLTL